MPGNSPQLPWRLRIWALLILVSFCQVSRGESLFFPGDVALRSDIQLLTDAGLLSLPVNVWPVSRQALQQEMQAVQVPSGYRSDIRAAWYRVMTRLEAAPRLSVTLAAIDDPVDMQRFASVPRGSGFTATYRHDSAKLTLRLSLTLQDRSEDRRSGRADESYGGIKLGSWLLSAGQIPRWWGPGHDGSLILSTNARPVPAIGLDTIRPIRFESRWLRWLGATHWSVFAGKLENDRFVSDAQLLGARFSLRPTARLEIGLSRTAQWGGRGRPQNLESLLRLVLGRDNRGDDVTLAEEPGNQLGGVDVRWSSPIGNAPYAVYAQMIGEDEAGGLPSRLIGMAGGEIWRQFRGGGLRLYAEIAETTVEFYKSQPRQNLAYEHFIYQDGYRYRGRSIGHAMDNDSLAVSVGAIWNRATHGWEGVIRRLDINTDGGEGRGRHSVSATAQERWELRLSSTLPVFGGDVHWGIGLDYINPASAPTEIEPTVHASWRRDFDLAQ